MWLKIFYKSQLEDGQCGFCPGRSTMDQILSLKQIFKKLKYLGVAFTSAGRQVEEFDI